MGSFKEASFADRRSAAQEAAKARLAKFSTQPDPDDPAVIAKEAARRAIVEAREARAAERERKRVVEEGARAERAAADAAAQREREAALEAERLQREAAKEAEEAERRTAQLARASRVVADQAEAKALRDARYAARKARQK